MEKLKSIISTIIMSIIIVLGTAVISIATTYKISDYKVGDTMDLNYNDYVAGDNLFCIQHHDKLSNTDHTYEVANIITIEGRKATAAGGKVETSDWNAKLAAAIHYTKGSGKAAEQKAIWYYMYNWVKNVGDEFKAINMGDVNNAHEGLSQDVINKVDAYVDALDGEAYTKAYITDKTNYSGMRVKYYEYNGAGYAKVGPFKLEFDPKLKSFKVRNQNGNNISNVLFMQKDGDIQKVLGSCKDIKSGKNFYMLIPTSSNTTALTSVEVYTEEKVSPDIMKAKLALLITEPIDDEYQNLMIVESSTKNEKSTGELKKNIFIELIGKLNAVKVDKDNHEIKLANVGFKLQHNETGKWVKQAADGTISLVEAAQATEFLTDANGNLVVDRLIVGTYTVYETSNPNYGYKFNRNGVKIIIDGGSNIQEIFENEQVYIKLSGYVWLDKISGKMSTRNDLFKDNDYDDSDILVPGVTVNLKEGDVVVSTTTTNESGAYEFKDVLIEKLGNYYIEFVYNGLTYTNVIPHIDRDNGSKAAENSATRADFNQKFSVVENGVAKDSSGNVAHNLTYSISEHVAGLNGRNQMNYYTIPANTNETGYSIKNQYDAYKAAGTVIEGIPNINLGLYEREQPDIALIKDIENVRLTINGYEHTYKYAQRFENQGEYGDGFNVGVKFGEKYGKMRYYRPVYKADYNWTNEADKSRELQVYITYKLGVKNSSTALATRINNIVDYYDSTYEFNGVGLGLDERGNVTDNIDNMVSTYNSEYNKLLINTNMTINPQEQKDVYIQFKLSREKVAEILHEKGVGEKADETKLLDNVAEINSYSTFNSNGVYAGVDLDSNPGNAVPGDINTYEDDTDKAPALQLEVTNARVMQGKVFFDSTTGELKTGEIREGSGTYDDGELGIEGVKIALKETSGTGLIYYLGEDVKEDNGNSNTDANGEFSISGFIPGDYQLVYTWGDETYTVQNYKGTVYKESDRQNNKKWYEVENPRYSDAMDDYNTRLAIDEQLKNVKYNSNEGITINKMESTTPTMGITVEDLPAVTASIGDKYEYIIRNVDFGIVERARQEVELEKRVKTVKLVLANGEVLSNAIIEEDSNGNRTLTGERAHLTNMGPQGDYKGFVKAELDNEIIQGANIEVGYEITVLNKSEVDYLSENYYKYGVKEGNIVTLTPTHVIDYLDNDWSFENDKNKDENGNDVWEAITLEEMKDQQIVSNVVYDDEASTITEKIILHTKHLGKELKPTKTNSVMLYVSKTLTTTDDISLDNETEIIEINKTGGSKIISVVPGNYVPGKGETQDDDDMAETVIVTPSTGANLEFVLPITIGLVSLAILGVGVIIIKKKVLDNK